MQIPVLESNRLRLRGWQESDLDAFARLNANPEFMRFLGAGVPIDRAESFRVMAMIVGHWHLRGCGLWVVEEKATGRFVGRIGLIRFEDWPALELGWGIHPEHKGKGYATEAAKLAADWAFQNLDCESLISLIDPENNPSKAVAKRLGERFDHSARVRDRACDVYKMTRAEFYQHNSTT